MDQHHPRPMDPQLTSRETLQTTPTGDYRRRRPSRAAGAPTAPRGRRAPAARPATTARHDEPQEEAPHPR